MTKQPKRFEIHLTDEQKAQVKAATGKDAEIVELSVEELEERIAPATLKAGPQVIIGPRA